MKIGNLAVETAERRVEAERDAGVAAVRAALRRPGTLHCVSCGEEIEPGRRTALPSAKRCIDCQSRIERFRPRGR